MSLNPRLIRTMTRGLLLVACFAATVPVSQRRAIAQSTGSIVSNGVANQLGLERVWSTQVRVDPARGRVQSIRVYPNLILAHTSMGTVQAIDPETGGTLWATGVGNPRYETLAPSANDKHVAVTNGSSLFMLERQTGAVLWEQSISGSPSAGTEMNAEMAFVPLDTGIVEAYKIKRETGQDKLPARYSGRQGAVAAPLFARGRLHWTVPRGYVYSREVGPEVVQFRFEMDDDASAPAAYMLPFVYAASRAGTVYCLNEVTGAEHWRFRLAGSVSHPIVTVDGALIAVSELGEMARLNPMNGLQQWYQREVSQILSVGSGRIYAVTTSGALAAYDLASGRRLGAVAVPTGDLTVHNQVTDRIYLATTTGLLQCLRETSLAKPLVHTPGYAIAPKLKPGEQPAAAPTDGVAPADGAAPAPPAPAPPAAANPFGGT